MAKKSGKARIPSPEQQRHLFEVIKTKRHPEKNTCIMQISFKLGLRVQEIALLQLKEVARLDTKRTAPRSFKLLDMLVLPAAYTKGAKTANKHYFENRSMTFKKPEFDRIVKHIEKLAKAGAEVDPFDFYPPVKAHKGKTRELPLVDADLREALSEHLEKRLERDPGALPTDPLFVTQKGGAYTSNTLQEHMALMLRGWAGIERASSHSGRRFVINDVVHNQEKSIRIAQAIAGHVNPSTTVIYTEPPENSIADALNGLSNSPSSTAQEKLTSKR